MNKKIKPRIPSLAALAKARVAKQMLDECTGLVPTIDQLSTQILLNRVCLNFAFKRLYQIPIAKYAREQKIKKIKTLLLNHTLTLDSIALDCGYNSAPALVRFFKQIEGECPGTWRKRNII